MDFCYFIGIDIAKETATADRPRLGRVHPAGFATQPSNSQHLDGHQDCVDRVKGPARLESQTSRVLYGTYCAASAGIYNAHLLDVVYEQKLSIWLESSLQIKQAGGMQRGKTDKVDAQPVRRCGIAQYAYRFRDQMRLWEPPREIIQKLAFLSATRQRINQAYNLLAVPVAEQETFISRSLQKTAPADRLKSNVKKPLSALKEEQKAVEQAIKQLIEADTRLKELFDLMISVPGIGPVIATELLIATNEMQTINDPKKLACHAGVAPFEFRSGTSIRLVNA